MSVIWHWLERGQLGLFIQLHFTASVFFSAVTSLSCILISFVLCMLHIKYVEHFETNLERMDKFKFGYSTNNIPITTERKYNSKVLEKIEALTKRMRWKAFSFEP